MQFTSDSHTINADHDQTYCISDNTVLVFQEQVVVGSGHYGLINTLTYTLAHF